MEARVASSPSWWELPGDGPGACWWLGWSPPPCRGGDATATKQQCWQPRCSKPRRGSCKSAEEQDSREGLTPSCPGAQPLLAPAGLSALGTRTTRAALACPGVSENSAGKGETCSRPTQTYLFLASLQGAGGPRQPRSAEEQSAIPRPLPSPASSRSRNQSLPGACPQAEGISRRCVHSCRKTSPSAEGWPRAAPPPACSPASPPSASRGEGPGAPPGGAQWSRTATHRLL